MKHQPALAVVCLLIFPSVALADQISPNPNPAGNTITVDRTVPYNSVQFTNLGTIDITTSGILTFQAGSAFENTGGTLNNSGTINSFVDDLHFVFGGTTNFENGSTFLELCDDDESGRQHVGYCS